MRTLNSIRKTSVLIEKGGNSRILIPEFIDDFNSASVDDKTLMIQEAPIKMKRKHIEVYLAAVADFLCHRDNIKIPEWTKKLYLKKPYFYGGEKLKPILLIESPVAFRRRNLFVSANAVMRV